VWSFQGGNLPKKTKNRLKTVKIAIV